MVGYYAPVAGTAIEEGLGKRGGEMQEFSEVEAVASRNRLHQILATNTAIGAWRRAKCSSPRPDWYRAGAGRGSL
jgi:hypothetical protein